MSASSLRAVSMMIGSRSSRARSVRHTERPSMSGSVRSSSTMSTAEFGASRASSPCVTCATSKPSRSSARSRGCAIARSSSTSRIDVIARERRTRGAKSSGAPLPGRFEYGRAGRPAADPASRSLPPATGYGHATMTAHPRRARTHARPDGQLVELAGHRRRRPRRADGLRRAAAPGCSCSAISAWRTRRPTSRGRSAARLPGRSRSAAARAWSCSRATCSTSANGTDVEGALLAHPRLAAALTTFMAGADHRLIVLPGVRDGALAHDPRAIDAISRVRAASSRSTACSRSTRASGPGSCTSSPGIGSTRRPPSSIRAIPTTARSRSTSRATSLRTSRPQPARTRGSSGSTTSSTGARPARSSRRGFAYRRLLRRSGWLVVPALVGLALFWSFFELTGRRTHRELARRGSSGCSAAG